jgi:hypothetical protein
MTSSVEELLISVHWVLSRIGTKTALEAIFRRSRILSIRSEFPAFKELMNQLYLDRAEDAFGPWPHPAVVGCLSRLLLLDCDEKFTESVWTQTQASLHCGRARLSAEA